MTRPIFTRSRGGIPDERVGKIFGAAAYRGRVFIDGTPGNATLWPDLDCDGLHDETIVLWQRVPGASPVETCFTEV